jgi:protein tyrosine/serine phosphatase
VGRKTKHAQARKAAPRKPRFSRRALVISLVVLAIVAGIVLGFLGYIGVLGGNIREVVAGKAYRSSQLTPERMGALIDQDHIQTVINLRGSGWGGYAMEIEECDRRKVKHVDIPMSASVLPNPKQLKDLLNTFDHAQYPVLFHCMGGADRSGLVGTLYLHLYQHVPLDEAEQRQLTWRYGHFKWGAARAMDEFFDLFRKTNRGRDLRVWIETMYPSIYDHLKGNKALAEAG